MPQEKIKILAFYLPQYHPIPENDTWWGKGFTEWTNVTRAKSLFKGHVQPNFPSDLGFYDLRVPEAREAQATLAKTYGIDGFCYWHYWFGNGKELLERPFREVLISGNPDLPFCLAWANQSWTGKWHGLQDQVLIEQTYPGKEDYVVHFNHLLPAFRDSRYIKVDNKPVFIVYTPDLLPDPVYFTGLWNELAIENGFNGIHFIGIHYIDWDQKKDGFDEKTIHQPSHYTKIYEEGRPKKKKSIFRLNSNKSGPEIFDYKEIVCQYKFDKFKGKDFLPTVLPNWDNTPRSNNAGWVFQGSTPGLFKQHLEDAMSFLSSGNSKSRILFIKSWNEWAEGNYLEPDLQWGKSYLETVRDLKKQFNLQ